VRALTLPAKARIADRAASDSIMRHASDLPHGAPYGVFRLSRVAYAADGQHALFLAFWGHCGGRCAELYASYVVRGPDGIWRVDHDVGLWSA